MNTKNNFPQEWETNNFSYIKQISFDQSNGKRIISLIKNKSGESKYDLVILH